MKIITFLLLIVITFSSFSQTNVDFEAAGTDWNWVCLLYTSDAADE